MIISKTPFRMSFVGGGSDLRSFYKDEVGAVLSTSIDKYMYICLNKKFDEGIRLSYTRTENVSSVEDIIHPLVRESLQVMNLSGGLEISSMADIPSKGSGLGSSSSYTVGLLNALSAFKHTYISKSDLAKLACEIEINRCKAPIGKQDQYIAAYGGLNLIRFFPDESVAVEPILANPSCIHDLEESIIVFYTGRLRNADSVLQAQFKNSRERNKKLLLRRMVELTGDLKKELESNSLNNFGSILNENWRLKTQLSTNVMDSEINDWYQTGMKFGAEGGKILGAGNGGFLMFFAPRERHQGIVSALHGLQRQTFKFEKAGSQIVFYQPNEISL